MEERRKIKQIEKFDENGELEYTIIPNYRVHENFMTKPEVKFYKFLIKVVVQLKKEYDINLTIFSQVALNRIIDVNNNRHSKLYENIRDRSIDFVLYDEATDKIYCCIELNDETHNKPERIKRDNLIKKALDGNIKIIFIERKENYNLNQVLNEILSCRKQVLPL